MSRRIASLAVGTVIALALAACGSPAAETDGPALPRVATVVAYPALPSGLELGIFDEAFDTDATQMTIDHVASGSDGAQALISGHTDIVIGGYFSQVFTGDSDARILAISETSPETHAILVREGSEFASLDELEGRTLGGFSAKLPSFLALMLEQEGLGEDYFNYIQVPNDGGLAALTSGAIDAWYTWDPFYAQAEIEGLVDVVVDGTDFYLNPIVIFTTERYLESNRDSVEAFLAAYVESTNWVNQNPGPAGQYMAEATGMSEEAAEITISRRHYEVVVPDEAAIAWMGDLARAEIELDILTEVPDFDTAIDTSILEEVLTQ